MAGVDRRRRRVAEIERARKILAEGTSADRQLRVYESAIAAGGSAEEALRAVVDHLIAETVADCASDVRQPVKMARPGLRTRVHL